MKTSHSILTAASLSAFVAFVACSSSVAVTLPNGVSVPASAVSFGGTLPSNLSSTCTAGDYYVWASGGPCPSTTYLLCDGTSWSQYDCTDPSSSGDPWAPYSGGTTSTPGCTVDSDCATGDFCDLTTGDCVAGSESGACTSDADCTGASEFCDTAAGKCVTDTGAGSCTSDAECGTGETCDTASGACVGASVADAGVTCTSDSECASDETCDTASGACVASSADAGAACTSDSECNSGETCDTSSGTCVAGAADAGTADAGAASCAGTTCSTDAECTCSGSTCDTSSGTCT